MSIKIGDRVEHDKMPGRYGDVDKISGGKALVYWDKGFPKVAWYSLSSLHNVTHRRTRPSRGGQQLTVGSGKTYGYYKAAYCSKCGGPHVQGHRR